MEFALSNTHWLDALSPPLESYLVKLCDTVARLLQQQNEPPQWQKQRPRSEEIRPFPEPKAAVARPEPNPVPSAAKGVSLPERIPEPPHAALEPEPVPVEVAAEAASIAMPTREWPGKISGAISKESAGEPFAKAKGGLTEDAESESDRGVVGAEKTAFEVKTAAISKKQNWVRVLVPILVILLAVALIIWTRTPSTPKTVAENQQANAVSSPSKFPPVDLAKVETAIPIPDADNEDAIVVTVTRDGKVYLGQNRVATSELGPKVRDKLANKVDKTIFVRADARAQYQGLEDAIDAMRGVGADAVGLLTWKKENGGNAPLKSMGLEVLLPSPPNTPKRNPSTLARTTVVQVVYRSDATPAYKINLTDVARADLQSRLTAIYANLAERVMFVKGDDGVDFQYIADVIDIGRASGVDKIGLLTPGVMAGK
jgi:biopolymer transport protein ExbD